jgi:hypothetical protein
MVQIVVEPLGPLEFSVLVRDGGAETSHKVLVPKGFGAEFELPPAPLETVVERSFEFLLEREPASRILGRFTLDQICRYFPEYPREITLRLS